jgi:ESAT-6 family protein
MGDVSDFAIDADDLDAVIGDVERTEGKLSRLTEDIEATVRTLHSVWVGLAAEAQKEAQEEWDQGLLDMREALADLRDAARAAHTNYTGSARTNLAMWEQLR